MPGGVWRPIDHRTGKRKKNYRCKVRGTDGVSRVVSTGESAYAAALAAVRRMKAAARPVHEKTSLRAVMDAWLASRDVAGGRFGSGCASTTVRLYRRRAWNVCRVLGDDLDVNEAFRERGAGVELLERFVTARRADGVEDRSINAEIVVLRATLRRARRNGDWTGHVEDLDLEFRPRYVPRTRYLTPDELARLLAQLSPKRARAVRFVVLTGCRNSEWQAVRTSHVDLARAVLTIPGTKTRGAHRWFPFAKHPELAELVLELLEHARIGGPLLEGWGGIRRDLARAAERAGIARVSPNDLRRTFATWSRARGCPVDQVAALLGHSSSHMVELVYGRQTIEQLEQSVGVAWMPTKSNGDAWAWLAYCEKAINLRSRTSTTDSPGAI